MSQYSILIEPDIFTKGINSYLMGKIQDFGRAQFANLRRIFISWPKEVPIGDILLIYFGFSQN